MWRGAFFEGWKMSNILTTITIKHNLETIGTVESKLLKQSTKPREQAIAIREFFNALAGASRDAVVTTQVNSGEAVAAHGTITLSSMVATDTLTVAAIVFTCETSGATGNQFNKGASDTLTAAAAVIAINANTHLSPYIVATSNAAVITITSLIPGEIGNSIAIAISAHGSVSGSGLLTSGANATTYSSLNTYHLGL